MLRSSVFRKHLKQIGITQHFGVPDSLLKDFCAYIDDEFPAKNHISGYNIKKYRFLKNRIFLHYLRFLRFLLMQIMAGIGRKWPDRDKSFKNVFLGFFRSVFMLITLISRK